MMSQCLTLQICFNFGLVLVLCFDQRNRYLNDLDQYDIVEEKIIIRICIWKGFRPIFRDLMGAKD